MNKMEILPIIYLGYMFISIYVLIFYVLLYLNNKKSLFEYPKSDKIYSVSIVIPAWNEEKSIKGTIEEVLKTDYPGLKEVLVIDDGSTDNTLKIARELEKKYKKVKVYTKKNEGSKAGALNFALKKAKGEIFVVVDADSYPAKDAIKKTIGFFDNPEVGAATCFFVPRNKSRFFEKLQDLEYHMIAFTRKLLGYVDAIYVTPGPMGMYRKSVLDELGGFDKKNITEDIEITWHLTGEGYKRKMCLSTYATTNVPSSFKAWWKQRKRWNIGGLQCIQKYRKTFLKKGMLGAFILPFFAIQLFLGIIGLSVFFYLVTSRIISEFLFTKYSLTAGVPLLTLDSFHITASFLNYLGIILFIAGFAFLLLVLGIMKKEALKKQSIFNLLFFSIIYLASYPFIMLSSIFSMIKRNYKWR